MEAKLGVGHTNKVIHSSSNNKLIQINKPRMLMQLHGLLIMPSIMPSMVNMVSIKLNKVPKELLNNQVSQQDLVLLNNLNCNNLNSSSSPLNSNHNSSSLNNRWHHSKLSNKLPNNHSSSSQQSIHKLDNQITVPLGQSIIDNKECIIMLI